MVAELAKIRFGGTFIGVAAALLGHAMFVTQTRAEELIPIGIQSKASAGAGQTTSRAAASIFHNPANLNQSRGIETYTELSYISAKYTFLHPDTQFASVNVNVQTPTVALGISYRPIAALAIGLMLYPTGDGSEKSIIDVPLELEGAETATLVDVVSKDAGFVTGVGLSYRILWEAIVGLGVIHHQEQHEVSLYTPSEDDPFTETKYGGGFQQYVLGFRSESFDRKFIVGASYRLPLTKKYSGDVTSNLTGEDVTKSTAASDYLPAKIGLGFESNLWLVNPFLEYTREIYTPGRNSLRQGLGNDDGEVDLVDTNNFILGLKAAVAKRQILTAAIGHYPGNVGDGQRKDPVTRSGGTRGVLFGRTDAITRTVFGVGHRFRTESGMYIDSAFDYAQGKRRVSEEKPGQGTYKINVMLLSVALSMKW